MAPKKRLEVETSQVEVILKELQSLYESGLNPGNPGSIGLMGIAQHLGMKMLKPRRKVSVMVVGNHSAGKSSFINWYTGDATQKTGVAIETRGFTFVTSGLKRDTLTGDATIRFYGNDWLGNLGEMPGMKANLFTEISQSKDKNFSVVDFVDTPGLVDGDMQYPFDVQDAIVCMADHVDLILIFFDPIGQATCKRCMEVVERLNQSANLEKLYYFMSKADAVEKESDRQRVLIQITQNLATRIRNSHAFNLPTFYIPKDDGESPIPNAIDDVCKEIDKAINMTVQKYLKGLQSDCAKVVARIQEKIAEDKVTKARNMKRTLQGVGLALLTAAVAFLVVLLVLTRISNTLCSSKFGLAQTCAASNLAQGMLKAREGVADHFGSLLGVTAGMLLGLLVMTLVTWRVSPVLTKKDIKKLEEYSAYTQSIANRESDLYDKYFKTLSTMDH